MPEESKRLHGRINNLIRRVERQEDELRAYRAEMRQQHEEIEALERSRDRQDLKIENLTDLIKEIKGDTQFIRRKFTGVLITASIGGIIGLFYAIVQFLITG